MGNQASKGKGHTLGGSSQSSPRTSAQAGSKQGSVPPLAPRAASNLPATKGKPANSDADREQRLAAIEARMEAQEKRGVQKGGGKLAAKLEDTNRSARNEVPTMAPGDDVVEMWKS
ncbi:hypothetical protein HDU83_002613 [Entophlyctis luteolus]|nr:hypothetical protein HDU82_007398 [Entophlyctis luteolus]KAJ3346844.1 hypothetical protein HDU83_002613 [Entophlyctis luteolus]KAJ3377159.1 hypothetical protein HDU84_008944 [Entophlyctis sp. JEL0112]